MQGSKHYHLNIFLSTLLILSISISLSSASLSTNSRWIVSPTGNRVKFRCVNWPGHLEHMIPEGLNKLPIKVIAQKIKDMRFNCVRLTWAVHMFTLEENKQLTVEQSLNKWNLTDAKMGIQQNNPNIMEMTIADAQKAVIDELGASNVMVVLDNHVTLPIWCCGNDDGNGFFNDNYFNPEEWFNALGIVADRYKGDPAVVGMSLRNELRGPNQNEDRWYVYMQQGAEMIHLRNPDSLVIVSGLNFDTYLNFLKQKPFYVTFKNKLVFESHAYAFGDPIEKWKYQTNEFCGIQTGRFFDQSGFLINAGDSESNTFPVFVSEFGVDLKVEHEIENYFLSCTLAYMAENDLDWALWSLQGSYMLRDGQHDIEEEYGILSMDWASVRNPTMLDKLQVLQQINFDPKSTQEPYYRMFHPQTGNCVQATQEYVYVNKCQSWAKWRREGSQIKLADGRCLFAVGDGEIVSLSRDCSNTRAAWNLVSGSKLHIAAKDEQGNSLCLEWEYPNIQRIVTKKCLCVDINDNDLPHCEDNPMKQWFKLILSNLETPFVLNGVTQHQT